MRIDYYEKASFGEHLRPCTDSIITMLRIVTHFGGENGEFGGLKCTLSY